MVRVDSARLIRLGCGASELVGRAINKVGERADALLLEAESVRLDDERGARREELPDRVALVEAEVQRLFEVVEAMAIELGAG